MSYEPRLKAPTKNNKYYNTAANGGYLKNILGNYPYNAGDKRTGLPGLNVLPNCVGYVAGRWNELCGKKKLVYDLNTDAKLFPNLAKKYGFKTGKTPKLGAIIVWSNNKYGHVGIVEQIISDTEIVISQSGWSYKGGALWTATHRKGKDGNWIEGEDFSWMSGRYKFDCFIYHPDIEEDNYKVDSSTAKIGRKKYSISTINDGDKHYVKLRDLDDVLGLCKVGYDSIAKKVTIDNKAIDIGKCDTINKDNAYYINIVHIARTLNICNIIYTPLTKVFEFKPK